MLPATLVTLAALAVLLWGEARQHATAMRLSKPVASVGFVAAGVACGGLETGVGQVMLVALVLCAVGDVCLLSRGNAWFLAGLTSFLLGHVAFAVAFGLRGPAWGGVLGSAVPLGLAALGIRRWLTPYVPARMRRPVDAYILVITSMVAMAVGATMAGGTGRIALGALAFFLSDLAVARDRFVRRELLNRMWGLPLYYGAQLVLASTIGR